MHITNKFALVVLMSALCLEMASAQQFTIKREKMTVTIEKNKNCPQGISVSGRFSGDRHLCADYPEGVSYPLRKLIGSAVEVEAFWTFEGDPRRETPVGLGKVIRIGGDKVGDAVAAKAHFPRETALAANSKEVASTVAVLGPGSHVSDATARAAASGISNERQK